MEKEKTGWIWRKGELSLKEFYNLSSTKRNEYISMLEQLPQQERSSGDNIILSQYSRIVERAKQFLSLDDLDF
jgi:hypothetical protein